MSRTTTHPSLVFEWSPREVTAFDGLNGSSHTAGSFAELPGYSGREAIIAVSRRALFIRAVRMPNAAADEIRTVIQIRLGDLFPVAATELAFDFTLTNDTNADGRLTVVMAMPSAELRKLLDEAKNAGIKVKAVLPAALGSGLLASSLGKPDAAVLESAEGGLAIDIISAGTIRASRVVPANSNAHSEVVRTYSMVSLPTAPIIAAGGLKLEEADVSTQTSTIAALIAPGAEKSTVNLELPETIFLRSKSARDGKLRRSVVAAVIALGAVGLTWYDHSSAAAQVADAQSRNAAALEKLKSATSNAQARQADAQATQATLARALSPAQTMADVLTLISNRVPDGLWLTGVNAERGKLLQVRGTALTTQALNDYLARLQKDVRLRDVLLVSASTAEIERKPIVNFVVSVFPVGNLPLLDSVRKTS